MENLAKTQPDQIGIAECSRVRKKPWFSYFHFIFRAVLLFRYRHVLSSQLATLLTLISSAVIHLYCFLYMYSRSKVQAKQGLPIVWLYVKILNKILAVPENLEPFLFVACVLLSIAWLGLVFTAFFKYDRQIELGSMRRSRWLQRFLLFYSTLYPGTFFFLSRPLGCPVLPQVCQDNLAKFLGFGLLISTAVLSLAFESLLYNLHIQGPNVWTRRNNLWGIFSKITTYFAILAINGLLDDYFWVLMVLLFLKIAQILYSFILNVFYSPRKNSFLRYLGCLELWILIACIVEYVASAYLERQTVRSAFDCDPADSSIGDPFFLLEPVLRPQRQDTGGPLESDQPEPVHPSDAADPIRAG